MNSSDLHDFFKGPNTVTSGASTYESGWGRGTIQAVTGGFE